LSARTFAEATKAPPLRILGRCPSPSNRHPRSRGVRIRRRTAAVACPYQQKEKVSVDPAPFSAG